MAFYVGQRVVCVGYPVRAVEGWQGIHPNAAFPSLGQIYTIRAINEWSDATLLRFVEVNNTHLAYAYAVEPGFNSKEFRPVVERKTDVDIFEKLLNPSRDEVSA